MGWEAAGKQIPSDAPGAGPGQVLRRTRGKPDEHGGCSPSVARAGHASRAYWAAACAKADGGNPGGNSTGAARGTSPSRKHFNLGNRETKVDWLFELDREGLDKLALRPLASACNCTTRPGPDARPWLGGTKFDGMTTPEQALEDVKKTLVRLKVEQPGVAGLPAPRAGGRCVDCQHLLGRHQHGRVRRALKALFGGAVGKDTVSRVWRKVKADWDAWNARSLAADPIVRLILDRTVVDVRLDRKANSFSSGTTSVLRAVFASRDGPMASAPALPEATVSGQFVQIFGRKENPRGGDVLVKVRHR
jgi:hypothetical protein